MIPGLSTCFTLNNAGYFRLSLSLRSCSWATARFGYSTTHFGQRNAQVKKSGVAGVQELQNETAAFRSVDGDYNLKPQIPQISQIRGQGKMVFANYIFSGCILAAAKAKLLDLSHL
jgi:hypothetical protein